MIQLSEHVKAALAAGTILVTMTGSYIGMQKDIHTVSAQTQETVEKVEALKSSQVGDHDTIVRIDERTKAMKEQMDRIEKSMR